MKKIQWTLLSTVCFATLVICSCKKNDEAEPVVVAPVKDDAVYIVNEGSFGSGNGTIDYYSAKADSIANDIFGYVNAIPLGDVVQSMAVYNGRGYICVNNSQKLQVVNLADFSDFGSSGGFQGPRYFLGISNARGYVSDWFSDHVKVVDLTTLAVIDSIKTGSGPEQMVMVNQTVYVANVGGYGNDSTVTVINTLTNSVITTIQTGINPNSLQVDTNGNIWVLCGGTIGPDFIGGTGDDRAGSLVRINSLNNTIDKTFAMTSAEHPIKLAIDGSKAYFTTLTAMIITRAPYIK